MFAGCLKTDLSQGDPLWHFPVPPATNADAVGRVRFAQKACRIIAINLFVMVKGKLVTTKPLDQIALLMTHLC